MILAFLRRIYDCPLPLLLGLSIPGFESARRRSRYLLLWPVVVNHPFLALFVTGSKKKLEYGFALSQPVKRTQAPHESLDISCSFLLLLRGALKWLGPAPGQVNALAKLVAFDFARQPSAVFGDCSGWSHILADLGARWRSYGKQKSFSVAC